MRVRLTDQALAAVTVARALAGSGVPTAAMLLAGLAAEPDGRAGRRLRARASAAGMLGERARHAPSPGLDDVLRQAAATARRRSVATDDLLRAVVQIGGTDIADLLAAAGYGDDDLQVVHGDATPAETFAWGSDSELDPEAALVVAQVRAVDGGAVDLLFALAESPAGPDLDLDPDRLQARRARALRSTPVAGAGAWDAGLQPVIEAAAVVRAGERSTVRDLIVAAAVVGGEGPRALLEEDT